MVGGNRCLDRTIFKIIKTNGCPSNHPFTLKTVPNRKRKSQHFIWTTEAKRHLVSSVVRAFIFEITNPFKTVQGLFCWQVPRKKCQECIHIIPINMHLPRLIIREIHPLIMKSPRCIHCDCNITSPFQTLMKSCQWCLGIQMACTMATQRAAKWCTRQETRSPRNREWKGKRRITLTNRQNQRRRRRLQKKYWHNIHRVIITRVHPRCRRTGEGLYRQNWFDTRNFLSISYEAKAKWGRRNCINSFKKENIMCIYQSRMRVIVVLATTKWYHARYRKILNNNISQFYYKLIHM